MKASDAGLLGAVAGVAAAIGGVNGLGYLVLGSSPGYGSAQGGASLVFMLSLVAMPAAAVAGYVPAARLARRRADRA